MQNKILDIDLKRKEREAVSQTKIHKYNPLHPFHKKNSFQINKNFNNILPQHNYKMEEKLKYSLQLNNLSFNNSKSASIDSGRIIKNSNIRQKRTNFETKESQTIDTAHTNQESNCEINLINNRDY